MPSLKKSLIVEQFQRNYLKRTGKYFIAYQLYPKELQRDYAAQPKEYEGEY